MCEFRQYTDEVTQFGEFLFWLFMMRQTRGKFQRRLWEYLNSNETSASDLSCHLNGSVNIIYQTNFSCKSIRIGVAVQLYCKHERVVPKLVLIKKWN